MTTRMRRLSGVMVSGSDSVHTVYQYTAPSFAPLWGRRVVGVVAPRTIP